MGMIIHDRKRGRRGDACVPAARLASLASLALALVALTGCSSSNGLAALNIDPGHYSVFRCPQLQTRMKELDERIKRFSDLMQKADDGPGGEVIGTLTYRANYEDTIAERNLVLQTAAEKHCSMEQPFQSDQSIR
jgi:hypothetical protein